MDQTYKPLFIDFYQSITKLKTMIKKIKNLISYFRFDPKRLSIKHLFVIAVFLFPFLGECTCTAEVQTNSLLKITLHRGNKLKPEELNATAKSYLPDHPRNCLDYGEKAYTLAIEQKRPSEIAKALNNMGAAYYNLGRYDSAMMFYQKALSYEKNKNDIANTLNNVALVYADKGKYDQSLEMHNQALAIFRKVNNADGEANTLNYIGNIGFNTGKYKDAIEQYEKSCKIREKIKSPELVNSINNIGNCYKAMKSNDQALSFYKKGLENSRKLNNKKLMATTLNLIGNLYWSTDKYDNAMEYYLESLALRREQNDIQGIANSFNNIGNIYNKLGNYPKALEYFGQSLQIYQKKGDNKKIASLLNLVGNAYMNLSDYKSALSFYLSALKLRKQKGDRREQIVSLNHIGTAFDNLHQNEQALGYYMLALEMSEGLKDSALIISVTNNLGNLYSNSGNYPKALNYFKHTLSLSKSTGDKYNLALSSRKIGEILLKKANYKEAKKLFDESLKIGQAINNEELVKKAFFDLYQYNDQLHNYASALNYYRLFVQKNESMLNKHNSETILEKQMNFEIESKEREIEKIEKSQRQEEKIQSLALEKQIVFRNSVILLTLLAFVFGFFIYRQNLFKKKTTTLLQEKYRLIGAANTKLKQDEIELQSLVETKDKFMSVIAHDIKNPLSGILGITEILAKQCENLKPATIKEYCNLIFESSKNLFELLENLLNWSKSQMGNNRFAPANMNLSYLIKEDIELFKQNAENKGIQFEVMLPEKAEVFADKEMISSVIRNLISNAIKFSFPDNTIKISCKQESDQTEVTVADQGKELTKEELQDLFRNNRHLTQKGTNNEKGSGLGLLLCKEFIEKHQGKIWAENGLNQETIFKFVLYGNHKP